MTCLMSVVDSDIDGHDGILADIGLSGFAGDTQEILVIGLFGAMIEAEAASSQLTETS